jgi:hypothetical protein
MPLQVVERIAGLVSVPSAGASTIPLGGMVSLPMQIGPRRRAALDFAVIARITRRFVATL